MAQRKMETTVTADTANRRVIVTVEHEDWQSFSRAVIPRARKEFKGWVREHIMFGDLQEVGTSLGYHSTREGRCISFMTYTY